MQNRVHRTAIWVFCFALVIELGCGNKKSDDGKAIQVESRKMVIDTVAKVNRKSDHLEIGLLTVVLSSKASMKDAQADAESLVSCGIKADDLSVEIFGEDKNRVCVGRFANIPTANAAKQKLMQQTHRKDLWILPLEFERFKEMYNGLIAAWNAHKPELVQKYIHPELGIFFLYAPGAGYNVVWHSNFDKAVRELRNNPELGPRIVGSLPTDQISYKPLPHFDCENGWSRQGAFVVPVSIKKILYDTVEQEIQSAATNESTERVRRTCATLQREVLQTGGYSFSFTLLDGVWYLSVMNVVLPCSA